MLRWSPYWWFTVVRKITVNNCFWRLQGRSQDDFGAVSKFSIDVRHRTKVTFVDVMTIYGMFDKFEVDDCLQSFDEF